MLPLHTPPPPPWASLKVLLAKSSQQGSSSISPATSVEHPGRAPSPLPESPLFQSHMAQVPSDGIPKSCSKFLGPLEFHTHLSGWQATDMLEPEEERSSFRLWGPTAATPPPPGMDCTTPSTSACDARQLSTRKNREVTDAWHILQPGFKKKKKI